MLTPTILTMALAIISFSTPATPRALPFQLIVSTPSLPTLVPQYLQCDGTVTSISSLGANYTFSDTSPLGEISCDATPIGTGSTSIATVFTGLQGKDSINSRFSIDEDRYLRWQNARFVKAEDGVASFVLDRTGTVWAVFGGTKKGVAARLLTQFV